MSQRVLGIHHLTAISGAPHQNYDFYTRVLGLKLVKKTVNYDDPGTYHLYYGDATGSPGSLLTFFPYEGRPGRPGPGQVTVTSYSVSKGQLSLWEARLGANGVAYSKGERFGQAFLAFRDPHGMGLEILESETAANAELGTFAGAVLSLSNLKPTQDLLEFLGYRVTESSQERVRMAVPGGRIFWS